jgi:glycosyltransferase involved in cell wall biosynthesis
MRILFIAQTYPPEMGAGAVRIHYFARHLRRLGHEVAVATGMPNYPRGQVFPQYEGKRAVREEIDGIPVYRTAYRTCPRNESKSAQARSYASFLGAALRSGLSAGRADLVVASSPPLFPAIAARILAKRWNAKLLLDIRDLWPDEIVACDGAREDSLPVRWIRKLERAAYGWADAVTCTTWPFAKRVEERGCDPSKIHFVPNGADVQSFFPQPRSSSHSLGVEGQVVLYSGLIGIKHGLEVALQAAALMRERRDLTFVFVGAGSRERALHDEVDRLGLDNVRILPERSPCEIPDTLASADVCLSALRPNPYFEHILSVKLFEYMACGRPVVGAHRGESARLIQESGGGVVVPPGDAEAMAKALGWLADDKAARDRFGANGRKYVVEHYSRQRAADRFACAVDTAMEPAMARGYVL